MTSPDIQPPMGATVSSGIDFLNTILREMIARHAGNDKDEARFGDIIFKPTTNNEGLYLLEPGSNRFGYSTDQPYLDIHFRPKDDYQPSVVSMKHSMVEASEWLKEASVEFPMVHGVTYKRLAQAACRSFGFEHLLTQDEISVSILCKNSIRADYTRYINNLIQKEPIPLEIAGVAARTENLANIWNAF